MTWIIPIATAAAQAISSYNNKPNTRDFMFIPPSKQEQFGNKAEKEFWRGMVASHTGAPEQVYRTVAQARGDYATSDAMGGGGAVSDPRFGGATARALQAIQDQQAQEAAAIQGQKTHAWALGGKFAATARRADLQSAINQIHGRVSGQNMAADQAYHDNLSGSLWNLGSSAAGALGSYLGSTTAPAAATPTTNLSAGMGTAPGYSAWPVLSQSGWSTGTSPSSYYLGQAFRQPGFTYGGW